jgi:hypothetical protein
MRIYCKGCGDPYGYLDLFKAFKISSLRLDDCKNCRCSDRCGCTIEERGASNERVLRVR